MGAKTMQEGQKYHEKHMIRLLKTEADAAAGM